MVPFSNIYNIKTLVLIIITFDLIKYIILPQNLNGSLASQIGNYQNTTIRNTFVQIIVNVKISYFIF